MEGAGALCLSSPSASDVAELLIEACREPLSRLHRPKAGELVVKLVACSTLSSSEDRPSLRDLLNGLELTLEEAMRELGPTAAALEQAVARVLGSEPPLSERIRLRELQQAFVRCRVMAKKAWDLFGEYFTLPPLGPAGAEEPREQSPLGFLWLLFCTACGALLPRGDLVNSFALLLACTHFLLRHVPLRHQRPGAPGVAGAADSASEGSAAAAGDSLAAVAASHSAAEHLAVIRQLAGLLQELAEDLLLPALRAASTGASHQQPAAGGAQQAVGAGNEREPGGGGEAPVWPLTGLFDASGMPHPAAVAALQQRHRQQQQGAEGIGLDALDCLALFGPKGAAARGAAGQQAGASLQGEAAAAGVAAGRAAAGGAAGIAPMALDASAGPAASASAADLEVAGAAAGEPAGPAAAAGSALPQQRPGPAASAGGEPVPGAATPSAQVGTPPRAPRPAAAADTFRTPSPARRHLAQALPPATPVSTAMGSTAWLRCTVAGQPEGPSAALQDMMRASRLDAAGEARLVAAARDMAAAVFSDAPEGMQLPLCALEQSTAEARRSEGLRLYWRSLEALVAAEHARVGSASPGAAAALLAAPLFHRCVAACAFEVVIGAYRMALLDFPAVLHRLQLPAFDLCKVLEPFVLQLPTLPRDLKRHLLSVEERCLESLAWKQGSSLYAALIAAAGPAVGGSADGSSQAGKAGKEQAQGSRGAGGQGGSGGGATPRKRGHAEMSAAQGEPDAEMAEAAAAPAGTAAAAEQQAQQQEAAQPALPLSLGAETSRAGPTADAAEVEGSGGPQQGEGNAGTATWQHPSLAAQGDRSARAAVAEFLRRVLKLVAIRQADLLSRLDPHPAETHLLLAEAYTLAQHVAFEHTWLLYGRHVDQVMLCCLYAVCKVNAAEEATLRAIVAAYNRQPQARPEIFKSVSMTPRELISTSLEPTEHGDIISFYNKVFIPHTKPFLQRLADNRSLLSQPPACALPYLAPPAPGLAPPAPGLAPGPAPGGIPLPPLHPLRHAAQTPCAPGLARGLISPRGLLGTPTRGGAMQLLSPGAWRINRGGMAPLASPQTDQLAALRVAGSPLPPVLGPRPTPAGPMSSPAIHHMFSPGQAGRSSTTAAAAPGTAPIPPPPLATAAALAAAAAAAGRAARGVPQLLPLVPADARAEAAPAAAAVGGPAQAAAVPMSSADVLQLFAKAEASAAAAAAFAMAADVQHGPKPRSGERLGAQQEAEALGLTDLPSESLPLLAAAAVVAEEIERTENEVAAAFAGFCPGAASPATSAGRRQHDALAGLLAAPQQQVLQQLQASAAPSHNPAALTAAEAAAAGMLEEAAAAAGTLPAPPAPLGPRLARRTLNLQPAAPPVQ